MLAIPDRLEPQFRNDVLCGLAAPIPAVPSRWLYDARGCELFDEITRLRSYYLTRTESALLRSNAQDLASRVPAGAAVVDFGPGSAAKAALVLQALRPSAYVPVDVSAEFLQRSAGAVSARFPELAVCPVIGDFERLLRLTDDVARSPKLALFLGSTIGNFVPGSATDLLRNFRKLLGAGAQLLIGIDRLKPVERLLAAYDDPQGVTARFNLNLLARINRELDGTIPFDCFAHQVRWNEMLSRIEMHLVAVRDVAFTVAGCRFAFASGSTIHTENSHKYSDRGGRQLLVAGGWTPAVEWTDSAGDFAIILAEALPERFAP